MLPQPITSAAFFAASVLFAALVTRTVAQAPPAPPAAATVMSPGQQAKVFGEAQAAFEKQEYNTALTKIKSLMDAAGASTDPMYEEVFFLYGLGNLLDNKLPEAEAAFGNCLKLYPKGELVTRCHLGIGRACLLQDTPAKLEQAIAPLKIAARDPKFLYEAGLALGNVYIKLGKREEALKVFRSLMGGDVRTPQQTTAAIEVVGLLADAGNLDDLAAYLDQLSRQSGVRDALAWYANQILARGDELLGSRQFEAALIIYRSVPPRNQILEVQSLAMAAMKKDVTLLEAKVKEDAAKPFDKRTKAGELLGALKPAIQVIEAAQKFIQGKADLDAALLMRRGRCLYNLDRFDEALLCFRTIRTKHATTPDAERAAFAEIMVLSKLKNIPELKEKSDLFLTKFPTSDNAEIVSTIAGEVLVQAQDWKEVGPFYRDLESKFPKSESLERFVFYQGLAFFMEGNWKEATPIFTRFLKDYPESPFVENAMYYIAMANFLTNKYKESIASCKDYLNKFPDGRFAGDMHYRLAFIDFNDKEQDQSDKIIRELGAFLQDHPDDLANGSMLCLIGDTYKKKTAKTDQEIAANDEAALAAYKKAVETESLDDIMQYALDSATTLMQKKKDWPGIAAMHSAFMLRRPDSPIFLVSATQVAKMMAREGKSKEAAEFLTNSIKARIANPASEQVEFVIDEIVKALVPRKKSKDIDVDAIDKQLVEILNTVVAGQENKTTNARIYYARARLAQALKRADRSDLYLKGIATTNASDPSSLSPALLSVCGDILLKNGDLEGAEAMYKRLADRYTESLFSDAGPVGLGYVALARKQYESALKIFDNALENIPGLSRFKEATLGKLEAMVELGKYDEVKTTGEAMVGDKMFRGEISAKAYMLMSKAYRKQAAKTTGPEAAELLKKAHAYYQRVYLTTGALPDICAEAYWQAYESLKAMGETDQANDTLKALATHPKLQNTKRAKEAAALVK